MVSLCRATGTIYSISAPDQPGRIQIFYSQRVAKNAKSSLSKYMYCVLLERLDRKMCVRCELFQVFLFELSVGRKVIAMPVIKILEKGYKIK